MAGNGGKRPGAGRPKGSSTTWKRGDMPDKFGDRCMEIIAEALNSDVKADREKMLEKILPYVFSRKPQTIEADGEFVLRVKYDERAQPGD